jgi:cell division protein FtsN
MIEGPLLRGGSWISHMPRPAFSGPTRLVIRVRLRIVAQTGSALPISTPGTPVRGFTVQVGAFASRAGAVGLRDTIARAGEVATVSEADVGGETLYRVHVGSYDDRPTARAAAQRLAAQGFPVLIIER